MKLVTGAAGFFGAQLVQMLIKRGEEVRAFDIKDEPKQFKGRVEYVKADIRDQHAVEKACEDIDTVFHTVALLPISRAGKMFEQVNVGGTKNLILQAKNAGVKKIVHVSTSAVYGIPKEIPTKETSEIKPLGLYGNAKRKAELMYEKYADGIDYALLRPRTLVGPTRLGVFEILFDWIRRGKKVYIIGDGKNRFQLLHSRDLATGCMTAAKKECRGIFNIGADRFTTIGEELQELCDYAKTGARVTPINPKIAKPVLKILDMLKVSPLVDWHYMTPDFDYVFDISKLKKMGWKPKYSNIEMLKESYDWYAKNYKNLKPQWQGILRLIQALS